MSSKAKTFDEWTQIMNEDAFAFQSHHTVGFEW